MLGFVGIDALERPGAFHVRRALSARRHRSGDRGHRLVRRSAKRCGLPASVRNRTSRCPVNGSLWMSADEWSRSWKPWLRGTAIGFPLGALPAGGAELPTLLSYAVEKRLARRPEEFGHGAIEAVAGPEAANNASAAGTLVPLLTLGLPTSATAAVLLAAFQQFGLQPGPLLFRTRARAGVGRDRQPLRRQPDVARAQPAARRPVGEAARDPAAVALRRHPGGRLARRLHRASLGRRLDPRRGDRPARLRPARRSTRRSRR